MFSLCVANKNIRFHIENKLIYKPLSLIVYLLKHRIAKVKDNNSDDIDDIFINLTDVIQTSMEIIANNGSKTT